MGFFGKLFGGGEPDLPQLDPASNAGKHLASFNKYLEPWVAKMNDRLEMVANAEGVYVYIGKPPAMFGMVWFHDDKEHNFKTAAKDHGLSNKKLQAMSAQLGDVWTKYASTPKFSATIAGKKVIVAASEEYCKEVVGIIHNLE